MIFILSVVIVISNLLELYQVRIGQIYKSILMISLLSISASRGQLKLIAIAMLLAQSRSIDPDEQRKGIIAIDDLSC